MLVDTSCSSTGNTETQRLRLDYACASGLTTAEAAARLQRYGPNLLADVRSRGLLEILFATLKEPMFLLLIAAAGLYLVLGDLGEGLFVFAGAVVSVALVVLQESRSERALAALKELAEPYARVMRDGEERRLPARDLVPGDLILIGEGERLPADALLVGGDALTVDESTLTGESVPVSKRIAESGFEVEENLEPGDEQEPYVFAGTMIVRGQAQAHVLHTGAATQLGRIGASLVEIKTEPTLLQKTTGKLIARLGLLSIGFCGIVVLAYGLLRSEWINGALAGLTLSIALLPEEFPMVLAVFLSLGAWRLARHNVLVRRAAAIETLGAATILCVDKTGTLTENRMQAVVLWEGNNFWELPSVLSDERAINLIHLARLASAIRAVDPMDRAIRKLITPDWSLHDGTLLRSYPLRPELLAFIQAWSQADAGVLFAAKGAPEAIIRLCHVTPVERLKIEEAATLLAARGLRVLGVASCRRESDTAQHPSAFRFSFAGLIGFADPVRKEVPDALAMARRAGIDVAMITGDHPTTALEIARQAGISTRAGVLRGKDIASIDESALREKLRETRIFARVAPEQKLLLIEALKANGHVVVMTGDGINDAPAMKAAHIGIAMGQRGTDVAREAADIVLLDDRFASIVGGIRLGRRIFSNLRKALTYITAIHVPIAGLALLPILFGLPPLFFPMHVVLLELVVDPVCSLVFESEPSEQHAMEKPPRRASESLFGPAQIAFGLFQGAIILGAVFALYVWMLGPDWREPQARAAAFTALVIADLALAFANSAEVGTKFFDPRRRTFWLIAALCTVVVAATIYVPLLAAILRFAPPDVMTMTAAAMIAVIAGGWLGFMKRAASALCTHDRRAAF